MRNAARFLSYTRELTGTKCVRNKSTVSDHAVLARLAKSEFARNASLLFVGTLVAQAIPALISPVLTRLYSPAEFGAFAVFMSIATFIGIIATGRYEFATLLPVSYRSASAITGLVFAISGIVGFVALLVFSFKPAAAYFKAPDLGPLTALFFGAYPVIFAVGQALNYQQNRQGDFKKLAISRITQSVASVSVQIAGGLAGLKSLGLVLGNVVGQGCGAAVLASGLRFDRKAVNKRSILRQARKYWKFPAFSMPGDVLNLAAQQLPVFLLAAKFGIATAGFYALTQRVLGMPVALLGNAIGDVFKSQASREYVRTGSCRRLFVKCFLALFALSSVLFASSAIVSPQLFPAVFGKKWGEAGEYARILSLMYFFALMSSPLSYIYYVVEMQFLSLVWQAFLCASVSAALWLAPVAKGPKTAILWFSIAYSAMYIINLAVSFHLTQRKSAAVKT